MTRFEYYTSLYNTTGTLGGNVDSRFQESLNYLGSQGWELVSSVATMESMMGGRTKCIVSIFKRAIPETHEQQVQ